ncbi:hypothetical protein DTO166G4_1689 [Paecilomyces variotii]|nr:hypothetical protein DTO166G4_1689 [Paecilomyces variotii]KAJ9238013.1 hypothetical protein DTO166G5_3250 [Paecilomyces variotii]KAJ9252178.1 hypothetical protein DTO195F2_7550 [Paecilomyces variotii]KAJ9370562.1 hypothetical protein DTO282E5_4730 [Paecilomyces variotii]
MGHIDSQVGGKMPWVETPLVESAALSKEAGCRVFLKLELLQPSGSFKSRGIGNLILSYLSDPSNRGKELHFFSSSGGNAGLAAVVAARDLGCPCTVVVPLSTKPLMIQKLRTAGATDVIQHGASWFEADSYLRKTFIDVDESSQGSVKNVYIPPFDHPEIWKGAGTMIPELAAQLPPRPSSESEPVPSFPADVIICSVGGGGLFNGVIDGLDKYLMSSLSKSDKGQRRVQVIAAETKGADSLAHSLRNGSLQSLPAITSLATSLGALTVAPQTLKNATTPPRGVEVKSVVTSDAEAARGVVRLADEMRLLVELACGVSVEVAAGGRLKQAVEDLSPESRVVIVVCGGSNITAEMVAEYRQNLANGWD